MRYALILFISFLAACGGSSGSDTVDEFVEDTTGAEIRQTFDDTFGVDGNIFKPISDEEASGAGRAVILLDGEKYPDQFDSCAATLADGSPTPLLCLNTEEWTQMPFSCFSNPRNGKYRQTWRYNVDCEDLGSVTVECKLGEDTYRFTAPGGQDGNVCTRFG